MDIIKSEGYREPFDREKLFQSLIRAGARKDTAEMICDDMIHQITPEMTTEQIFRKAVKYLLKTDRSIAARYSLPRGLALLGPAGYIFEQYLEIILQSHGYITKQGVMIEGKCISHEVDIYAEKAGLRFIVEAKYRNEHHTKTHIDQVMYAHARLLDIMHHPSRIGKHEYELWVVTNTKFTDTSIRYARCQGFQLIGWNYPRKGNLEDLIRKSQLYPITILPSCDAHMVPLAAAEKLLLAQDILGLHTEEIALRLAISHTRATRLLREAKALMTSVHSQ